MAHPVEVAALCLIAIAVHGPLDRVEIALRGLVSLKLAGEQLADLRRVPARVAQAGTRIAAVSPAAGSRVELVEVSWGSAPLLPPQPPLIDRLSLGLEPGSHLGIAGASGSGKSVLARLLCGMLDPQGGRVLVDGLPAGSAASPAVALVARWSPILPETVRDTLRFGADLADATLIAALGEVGLWDELCPRGGLDLTLTQGGGELSGGQRARLTLARALLRKPRFLVLDAALDSIEPNREAAILTNLRRRRMTVALISARPSGLRLCDQLLTLCAGGPATMTPTAAR